MKSRSSYILAGIIYLLIPAVQRCLGLVGLAVAVLMRRLDRLAFTLAGKLARGE